MNTAPDHMTKTLAGYVSGLALGEIPDPVITEARRLILDTIGCILAATRTRIAPISYGLADFLGDAQIASVAGRQKRASLAGALYANGRLANCMDLDDTFPVTHHFGSTCVVSALALAEARGATGAQFLQAVVAGYELGGRVASACGPIVDFENGQIAGYPKLYSCATPVVFAAAGAAIQLERQDASTAYQTLGITGSNTPVPAAYKWATSVELPDCKYADAGWAAVTGVMAARSASLGATGFDRIFDGDHNVIGMSGTDSFDPDLLVGDLGSRWMMLDITYKAWPNCRWTHQALTALTDLLETTVVDPEDIDQIIVQTNQFTSTPRFTNPSPKSFCSRQFSIPHAIAMLLLDVPIGPAWLDETQDSDPRVQMLRDKVSVEEWGPANLFGRYLVRSQTRNMPTQAAILLHDGRRYSARSDFALGDPWTPATAWGDQHVVKKFRTVSGLTDAQADRIVEASLNIEKLPDVESLAAALRDI
ncbi:MmgE/PrpD family protein [Bradyrhizobium embrapense]|uniref:MmgE/PrpD family protein n=1 Tax=Bradyrhizobium embrapense TaxID=630921 RepID=UPI00067D085B|nr:MmgE/PrpD family protein [Bradyrhizobium embrapense]